MNENENQCVMAPPEMAAEMLELLREQNRLLTEMRDLMQKQAGLQFWDWTPLPTQVLTVDVPVAYSHQNLVPGKPIEGDFPPLPPLPDGSVEYAFFESSDSEAPSSERSEERPE